MIKVGGPTKNGGHIVILGLTPENLRRLEDNAPILADCEQLGLPGVKITLMFGQTERAIVEELRAAGIEMPDVDEGLRDVEAEHHRKGTTP